MDKNKNNFLVINKRIYKSAQKNIINKWKHKGKLLIDKCNKEKLIIDKSHILQGNLFYQYIDYIPGAYKSHDKSRKPILFIAYDMCYHYFRFHSNEKTDKFIHSLVLDIDGNIIRGVIFNI
jgi:hypothetical protein